MQQFKKDQQIPLTQVTDPNTGQVYYSPQNVVYNDKNGNGPQYLRNVIVDQATTASYFSGSITNAISASYADTASYLLGSVTSASYADTASYANYAETASSALNAQDVLIYVKNQSGAPIAKGVVVHITASGNSSDIPRVITASYENDNNSANTLGITNQSIANGSEGFVMTEGVLKGIDTNAFVSGQLIYLGATGSIIGYAPVAPLHNVRLGQVVRHQSNNGSIYVRIDNGYELEELHDVLIISASSGNLLIRSGSVWTNSRQLTGSYAITGSLIATSFTGSLFGTASYAAQAVSASYVLNAVSASRATTSSFASTASFVNPLTQSVLIGGNLTVGTITSIPSTENSLNVYPPSPGGTGEGGQILLAASGGLYTSASMLDNWQNQFRVLRGSNTGGSNAGLVYVDLQTGNTQFVGAVTASAYSGLPNDYLYATRATSNQTVGSAWANTDIIFNNVVVSKGISFNTSTGVASLTGGKVYRVTARLAWSAAATYNLQFSCYTSANTKIGPDVEIVQSSNGTNNISDGTLEFIYAPGSNTDIKIRCTANNTALSGEQIRFDLNTQFIIQQIS